MKGRITKFLSETKDTIPCWHSFNPYFKDWTSIDFIQADSYLPKIPSLYALFNDFSYTPTAVTTSLLYVGVSGNVFERFMNGHHKFFEFLRNDVVEIKICALPEGINRPDREYVEAAYINFHLPILNQSFPNAFSPTLK